MSQVKWKLIGRVDKSCKCPPTVHPMPRKRRRNKDQYFVKVHHLDLSGLYSTSDSFTMYARQEVSEMWQKLDIFASSRGKKSGLNVTGPPGTGKSMVAWAWTCYNSSRNKKNIVWIHVNKGNQKIDLCHFKDGYMHTYEEGSHELAATIKDIDADLMVVDGATNNEYGMFSSAATSWMLKGAGKRKVAFIMSASVVISSHHLFKAGIEEWHMPSWTWENYVAACDNTAFYDQIKGFLPKKKRKKKG